jgi:hypothetical protein
MAQKGRHTARKPATKFAHLRKKMEKTRIASKIGKKKKRSGSDSKYSIWRQSGSTRSRRCRNRREDTPARVRRQGLNCIFRV